MTRDQYWLCGGLALLAIVTPAVVLLAPVAPAPVPAGEDAALAFDAPPELGAALVRPLFGSVAVAEAPAPADAPALIGIAGRLNVDAVALVRTADGASRTLAVGEAVDGWQLRSLAIDAAFFTRGTQEVRVAMAE